MTERDWADGSAWGQETYQEKCVACGTENIITIKGGPPSGYEGIEPDCANCGHSLTSGKAFGLVSVARAPK